jgi:hypothetical protein
MSKGRMFLPGNEPQMNDTSSRRDFVRSLRIVQELRELQRQGMSIQAISELTGWDRKPFDDLFYAGPRLEILENCRDRHSCITKDPLTFPGMLSTAGHCDQSNAAITSSFELSYTRQGSG